eukprot:30868-Pelagococcus_subviridis.AAC.4
MREVTTSACRRNVSAGDGDARCAEATTRRAPGRDEEGDRATRDERAPTASPGPDVIARVSSRDYSARSFVDRAPRVSTISRARRASTETRRRVARVRSRAISTRGRES